MFTLPVAGDIPVPRESILCRSTGKRAARMPMAALTSGQAHPLIGPVSRKAPGFLFHGILKDERAANGDWQSRPTAKAYKLAQLVEHQN
jgi:hypothetical protein